MSEPSALLGFIPLLLMASFVIPPFWRIFKRLGHPGWYALLLFPPVGIPLLYYVAFSRSRVAVKPEFGRGVGVHGAG